MSYKSAAVSELSNLPLKFVSSLPSGIPSPSLSSCKGSVVDKSFSSGCHVSLQFVIAPPVLVSQGSKLCSISSQISLNEIPTSSPSNNPSSSLSKSIGLVPYKLYSCPSVKPSLSESESKGCEQNLPLKEYNLHRASSSSSKPSLSVSDVSGLVPVSSKSMYSPVFVSAPSGSVSPSVSIL